MTTVSITSNDGVQQSASAVLEVVATNPDYNQPALHIRQAGTRGGAASIRIDDPNPDIEFVSADESTQVVTLRNTKTGETVTFDYADIEDFVIWRGSNDTPGFLLANAVDDPDLGITHIVRGEDLLSSTPRVTLIRRYLGLDYDPLYAHLPLLVNEQRQKLSKRKDDVSVGDYPARGYLPQAMANYLALLGWGPPDGVEVRPMSEIVDLFRLEDVLARIAYWSKGGAPVSIV